MFSFCPHLITERNTSIPEEITDPASTRMKTEIKYQSLLQFS